MENKGLVFIPDISGYSRFVHEIEIEHSQIIIQELLEVIIDANEIGLVISEIEGDAILFYKFGERPSLATLYKQVEKMFCMFHRRLIEQELNRNCQCDACITAANLTLKVITHYGEFKEYTVRHFNQLIGKDIILAHQLLKNDIEHHEYWLVTQDLLQDYTLQNYTDWMKWNSGSKLTQIGEVSFQYAQLGHLKNGLES